MGSSLEEGRFSTQQPVEQAEWPGKIVWKEAVAF